MSNYPGALSGGFVSHRFVSLKPDQPDLSIVNPSNWNQSHIIGSGAIRSGALGASMVNSGNVSANAIISGSIASGAVIYGDLASGVVSSGTIGSGSVLWNPNLAGKPFVLVTPNGPTDGGDYGPNTVGTTTAGIQEAINALTSGRTQKEGVTVKGNLSVAATISIPSYTTLNLRAAYLKLNSGVNADLLQIASGVTETDILGGVLDGNAANNSNSNNLTIGATNGPATHIKIIGLTSLTGGGLATKSSKDVVFDGCFISSGVGIGISLGNGGVVGASGSVGCIISNCYIDTTVTDGIYVDQNSRENLLVGNFLTRVARYSIILDQSPFNAVIGNRIVSGASYGILVTGTANGNSDHNLIEGNTIENAGNNGIQAQGASGVLHVGNVFKGNMIRSSTNDGMDCIYQADCLIEGNVFEKSKQHGILIQTSNNVIFRGNVVKDSSQQTNNTYAGIIVKDSTSCIVDGNDSRETATNKAANCLIETSGAGTPDNNLFQGNTLSGSVGAILKIVGISTMAINNFGGNPFGVQVNPWSSGIVTAAIAQAATNPSASIDYVVKNTPVYVNSVSGNPFIQIKDQAGNVIMSGLVSLTNMRLPVGYKVNFGAFTSGPTTIVAGE